MPIEVLEERAVSAIVNYLKETLPDMLARLEAERPDMDLPMFKKIEDEYIDPNSVMNDELPFACVFVDDSEDETKDRALDMNTCSVRIMSLYKGRLASKKTYRYNAAIREVIQGNRAIGAPRCRATVLKRMYYTPIMRGNIEVRVAETYLEVKMEVERR
jgi:hypothetical protein